MKKIRLLCLCYLLFSSGFATQAQLAASFDTSNRQVSTKSLDTMLQELQDQFGVYLNYPTKIVKDKHTAVSENDFKGKGLEEILEIVLAPHQLKHEKIKDNYFVIFQHDAATRPLRNQRPNPEGQKEEVAYPSRLIEKLPRGVIATSETARQTISGKVTDLENGEALPGVNVLARGTTTGTVTDVDGNYRITVSDDVTTLAFSSIGYTTEEVEINGRTTINVSLAPDIQSLSEVVVVGYGTQEKRDITGSVSSISGEEISKLPLTSLDQGLQGQAAGVQVTQANAAPGGAISIRVRGGNSITGNNEPLYVIDGYPVFNDARSSFASSSASGNPSITTNPLATLNPNDIASIEVLKDASATAIYGARGANGVVLITTKRGKAGQSQLDFEYYTGVQEIIKTIPVLNGVQYAELTNEAFIRDGREAPFPDPEALGEGTDWQDAIFRTAPISNYQINFSKGNENTRYFLSGNYFNQDGIIIGSNFRRLSFRANVDSDINDRLKIGNNLTLSYLNNNEVLVNDGANASGAGVVHSAITTTPDVPIYDAEGNYFLNRPSVGPGFTRDNAVALALETTNQTLSGRALGNLFAEYEIMEGLTAKISVGADVQYWKKNLYLPRTTIRAQLQNGVAAVRTVQTFNWLNENTLNYRKTFNNRHNLNVLLGFTMQRENRETLQAAGQGFVNDILTFNDLSSASVLLPPSSASRQWSLLSYLSRVNYILDDKYLFTFSARADGSSRFGAENKYGFFPSGALGWRLSEEEFVKSTGLFDELKLRFSAGVTGNQEIPLYQSLSALGTRRYVLGDELAIGIGPTRVPNPDLRWERTAQYDLGLDMGVFDNRLRLTTDVYYKKTTDLLLEVQLPRTSGFAESLQNRGSLENRGLEVALGADIFTGDFTWSASANYSMNRDKILDLGDVEEFPGPNAGAPGFYSPGSAIIIREGSPLNSFYGYIADGIYRTEAEVAAGPDKGSRMEPGDLRFLDISGPEGDPDGLLTPDDRTIIGNAMPRFIYGLTNNFAYKNFDLSVFIQGVYGNNILNNLRLYELESMRGVHNNSIRVLDRWTEENPNGAYPKADYRGHEQFVSTRGIEDGSFLRLRNVILGYNLPPGTVNWLRSLRVYVSAQNLLTITDYTGYDPEVNSYGQNAINQGIDYGAFPRAKMFTAGINLGL